MTGLSVLLLMGASAFLRSWPDEVLDVRKLAPAGGAGLNPGYNP